MEEDLRRVKPLWIAVLVTADIVSVGTCIERILRIDLVGTVIALTHYEYVGHIVLLVPVLTLLASLWQIKLTYDSEHSLVSWQVEHADAELHFDITNTDKTTAHYVFCALHLEAKSRDS